jgi:arylsulfatase A-like enzyme
MKMLHSLIAATGISLAAHTPWALAQDSFPKVDPPFAGHVDIDVRKSTPSWPKPLTAQQGAPNIVLILIDDVGFSTTSTFGGPVDTPNFTRLAAQGLRYNEFHVNALCSPSRAALLSGRNAHEIGFGTVAELGAGYPGYNTLWPKDSASVAEVLKDNGYSTAAFGKWHNTPAWQVSPSGPFDRWPTGLGFEHFYGFLSGADNQYYPRIYRDTTPVEPPSTPEDGYHFTVDITNDAIHWLHQHDAAAGDKPFFVYFATGATHSPHQVPKEWIDKYKGKFDQGWDKLREENYEREKQLGVIPANAKDTPRPEGLPPWDSLSPDEKKLVAHEAEVYAGYAAQTDYEVGRLLQAIKDEGKSDNTIVLWIFGDNGGSAQGGPLGTDAHDVNGAAKSLEDRLATEDDLGSEVFMNHFAASWAWALSAPFQGTKEDASHLGGSRDPLIISWPARIKQTGGLRSQFAHLNDVAPTLYEAAGITPPKSVNGVSQTPLEGTSLVYTFDHPDEPSHHHIQYFATSGNRAIYKDGWWAGDRLRYTWEPNGIAGGEAEVPTEYNVHPWELYNLNEDYSQADDLAAKYPEKLKELQQLFDEEAKRNHVYPLLPAYGSLPSTQPAGKTTFIYREGVDRLTNRVAPALGGKPYTLTADIDIPPSGANGVIIAQGGKYGGFTLFVKNNHVVYEINAFGNRSGQVVSVDPLAAGKAHIVVSLTQEKPGQEANTASFAIRKAHPGAASLQVNGKPEGSAQFANVSGGASETLDVGSDLGSAVSTDYQSPNRFTGKIEAVTIQLQ